MTTPFRIYSDMIGDLVRDLTGRSDVRRASAVERSASLPEELMIEIITTLLSRYHRQVLLRWTAFLSGAIGAVSIAYLIQGDTMFACGIVGLIIAAHLQLTYRHTGRSLQALLQSTEDKELIPLLLLKHATSDRGARPQYLEMRNLGLVQLLPYVTKADDELWTSKMRGSLADLLRAPEARHNHELNLCVLNALAEIGDASALPRVQPYLYIPAEQSAAACSESADRALLAEAASRCVRAIRERAERKLEPTVLLRPAAADVKLKESLPRPVPTGRFNDASELVRSRSAYEDMRKRR